MHLVHQGQLSCGYATIQNVEHMTFNDTDSISVHRYIMLYEVGRKKKDNGL